MGSHRIGECEPEPPPALAFSGIGAPDDMTKVRIAVMSELDTAQPAQALGADGVALSNPAIQAIGCLVMPACHTNNCPVCIATQRPEKRAGRLHAFLDEGIAASQRLIADAERT